jgi:hypothetical protein
MKLILILVLCFVTVLPFSQANGQTQEEKLVRTTYAKLIYAAQLDSVHSLINTKKRPGLAEIEAHIMDSYFAAQIHKVQSSGLDPATTAAQVVAIQRSQQLYQNPFVNMAYTFMEPLPVGLIITLIPAAILRRKVPVEPTAAPAVMTT